MKLEFSRQIFKQYPNIKFHENPSESRVSRCDQTDGRTDVKHVFETWPCKKHTNQISRKSQWEPSFTMRSDGRTDRPKPCIWHMAMQETYKPNFMKIPVRAEFHDAVRRTDGRTDVNHVFDTWPCKKHTNQISWKSQWEPSFTMRSDGRTDERTDERTDGQT